MSFVNPYNFVSLEGKCKRSGPDQTASTYTGILKCKLKTLTPLFIPRAAYEKDTAFFSYDFGSENPKPVIPGSSIRGVVRCVYEAITNSCLSTVDDEKTLYKRSNEPRTGYGVLHMSELKIYPAEKIKKNYGDSQTTGKQLEGGTVLIGEEGISGKTAKEYRDALFVEKQDATPIEITESDFDRLVEVWKLYQPKSNADNKMRHKGVNEKVAGRFAYPNYLENEHIPVYYIEAGAVKYLAPACITKEVFNHNLKSILKEQGDWQPCEKKDNCCEACRLFGMIGDENNALASRVDFRDAKAISFDSDSWYEQERELPILGGPKTTATEFYMEDAGGEYYTYDYRVDSYRKNSVSGGAEYKKTTIQAKLRGRKFYWHSKTLAPSTKDFNEKLQTKVRAIKAEREFIFDVAFDRISAEELAKLKFALELNFDQDNLYAHKLGHGKPVGYGSVKIKVEEIKAYKMSDTFTLVEESLPDDLSLPDITAGKGCLSIRELKKLTDFNNAPENVSYPKADGETFKWFSNNKSTQNNFTKPHFSYVLPKVTDNDITLPEDIWKDEGNRATTLEDTSQAVGNQKTSRSLQGAPIKREASEINHLNVSNQQPISKDEKKTIKNLTDLTKKAGKPRHLDRQTPEANKKLVKWLVENPMPENPSNDLKIAYEAAVKKLKSAGMKI
ncbi:RAMP superfamily CRISPR-associated protein [Acetobacterium wieringae]|uniref:RAMP superfamily CRISPR-associated protein n=1 Tax=Acetobacterium wieringae TaxID=52694 RepID=A0ABY6HDI6_9FIRM|nr:RAMP superfamily CRISPR-associated protein [Acetobacterium wieringae]UYO61633.1 RAMP superfamily CRISPR-associated protein [Acetobacterium wieringae]